ncbi:hypothetical protein HJC23_009826 [Cyclotella cryptica]|uniref:Amino acid transporter transmembrane domain-containing protein n=1 Tax=Cyclotella cryptica TaxID=29204 RepID=A0ABD3PI51_9STRA
MISSKKSHAPPQDAVLHTKPKTSSRQQNQQQKSDAIPKSPFFRPSNPRLSQTPHGTRRPIVKNVPLNDEEKKSSLLGAYANLCNVTIGAGIVGLPYAIKEAGMISGTIMIIVCATMTDYSLRQVISTGKLANVNSYETLMEATFGRPGFIFLSLNMLFLSYGAMIAYLTIIKDVLPVLFGVTSTHEEDTPHDEDMKRIIMLLSSLIVILPLSMQRDMADLEKTSRLNVVLNLILVAMVTGYSPVVESVRGAGGLGEFLRREMFFDENSFFVGFGVASFAFVCQDSSFIIAGSLSNPTKSRWKVVTRSAMLTCCTLELTIGLCGYLAYRENTVGNVLNNMDVHHWSGLVSRAILATTMFFAYPMNLYIARHACVVLFFEGISAHEGDDHIVLSRNDRRVILTWILYMASLLPALMNLNTGLVLSAAGAIVSFTICFRRLVIWLVWLLVFKLNSGNVCLNFVCKGGSSLAYIGPGMTFIAVYHSEFIALIQSRWSSSSKYLWCYPPVDQREEQSAELSGMDTISIDVIIWYLLLMPFWSTVAQVGQRKMAEYTEKEDSLSPGVFKPKRLTVVPPRTHLSNANRDVNRIQMPRYPSDSALSNVEQAHLIQPKPPGISYGSATPSLDTESTTETSSSNRLSAVEIEVELKREDPSWKDFYIAMFYVVVGVVAMTLGLASIMTKS